MSKLSPFMIIDIGSYTISFTIYESLSRLLNPLVSRHARASLGEGVLATGNIQAANFEKARFAFEQALLHAELHSIPRKRIYCLATAALRMAKNGGDIVQNLEQEFKVDVRILSGEEEAHYAATGIISEYPDAHGIIGDLGGASLELSLVENRAVDKTQSLGFGHLTFHEVSSNRKEVKKLINKGLLTVPWVNRDRTPCLYLTGGAWRTIGRLYMSLNDYPIENVHHFKMKPFDAYNFFDSLASLLPGEGNGMPDVHPDRQERMSVVALLALQLMRASHPQKVVFCANGLRHGYAYDLLSDDQKQDDPLEIGIRTMAPAAPKGKKIIKWLNDLLKYQDNIVQKLVSAAAFMCDISKGEHPKYEAIHAFERASRWPFMGISHGERVFLGLILYVRYGGNLESPKCAKFLELLSPDYRKQAEYFGHALRLACVLAEHNEEYLASTSLTPGEEGLFFERPDTLLFQDNEILELLDLVNTYYLTTKPRAA